MTFKHNDFGSSELMRSLERVALERGLIKPEDPITKQASAPKSDFEPTSNLMENIFKLCAGLREQNLIKEALELEMNYLNYKQAQTLYEVSKETGEDILEMAHPEGSHTLKNVEGDEAVIEDLLDKHVKIMRIVEKKPHGKLASSRDVIDAVKIVLGEDANVDALFAEADANLQKFRQVYDAMALKLGEEAGHNNKLFDSVQFSIDKKSVNDTRLADYLINILNNLKDDAEPGFFAAGDEKATWQNEIIPMIAIADRYAIAFQKNIRDIVAAKGAETTKKIERQFDPDKRLTEPATTREPTSTEVIDPKSIQIIAGFNQAIKTISLYKARLAAIQSPNVTKLISWLDQATAYATKARDEFSHSENKTDQVIYDAYVKRLDTLNAKLNTFQQRYFA